MKNLLPTFLCLSARTLLLAGAFSVTMAPYNLAFAGVSNDGMAGTPEDVEQLFAQAEAVTDDELQEVRGAFIADNGMVIDFGLLTQTALNGSVVHEVKIDGNPLQQLDANALKQVIQISESNVAIKQLNLENLPNVVTLIQNSANNQLIQQNNVLTLDISNLQAFERQGLVPMLNYHSSMQR